MNEFVNIHFFKWNMLLNCLNTATQVLALQLSQKKLRLIPPLFSNVHDRPVCGTIDVTIVAENKGLFFREK